MQNLDKQIWKSRIAISTKLKLYNSCILPIFLYDSECWAVTKRDVLKIDALVMFAKAVRNQMVPSSAERREEMDNRATTPVGYCPSTAFFSVRPQCTDDKRNRCQEASPSENWRRPPGHHRTTWMKTIQQDLKSNNLSLDEALM